jgi:hypothetical protein
MADLKYRVGCFIAYALFLIFIAWWIYPFAWYRYRQKMKAFGKGVEFARKEMNEND